MLSRARVVLPSAHRQVLRAEPGAHQVAPERSVHIPALPLASIASLYPVLAEQLPRHRGRLALALPPTSEVSKVSPLVPGARASALRNSPPSLGCEPRRSPAVH